MKHDCYKCKEGEKEKKTSDSEEEMKEGQHKKSIAKIDGVNVVTHDNDNGNDVLFVSSCFHPHALLANIDGDMHTWNLDS